MERSKFFYWLMLCTALFGGVAILVCAIVDGRQDLRHQPVIVPGKDSMGKIFYNIDSTVTYSAFSIDSNGILWRDSARGDSLIIIPPVSVHGGIISHDIWYRSHPFSIDENIGHTSLHGKLYPDSNGLLWADSHRSITLSKEAVDSWSKFRAAYGGCDSTGHNVDIDSFKSDKLIKWEEALNPSQPGTTGGGIGIISGQISFDTTKPSDSLFAPNKWSSDTIYKIRFSNWSQHKMVLGITNKGDTIINDSLAAIRHLLYVAYLYDSISTLYFKDKYPTNVKRR